jgi:hypothetical protein
VSILFFCPSPFLLTAIVLSATGYRLRSLPKPAWATTKMSLSGNSNDRPSIPYQALGSDRVDNSKAKGIQRGHNAMVFLVTIFIISSTFFSIIPVRSTKSKPAIPPLYSDGIDAKFMSAGSSMRALTWAERNDRTWSDAKCQKEFPLLYPQLEQVTQYWKERGGLNKSVIDMNEEHVKPNDGTGYVRVSGRTIFLSLNLLSIDTTLSLSPRSLYEMDNCLFDLFMKAQRLVIQH